MIPDYDAVVIDEAHELTARVTQAATDELAVGDVERAARRASASSTGTRPGRRPGRRRRRAGGRAIEATLRRPHRPGARRSSPTRWCWCATRRAPACRRTRARPAARARPTPAAPRPRGWCRRSSSTPSGWRPAPSPTCCGSARPASRPIPARLHVAPLQVWGQMRDKLLHRQDGGLHQRDPDARRRLQRRGELDRPQADRAGRPPGDASQPRPRTCCRGGASTSARPFDYGQQAILYVARHLPPPGRDGLGKAQLDEICELVDAADGRTLGLFSSRRAAETAAEARARAAAPPDHAGAGRRAAARAGQAVRRGPAHLPVRHAVAVAGPRRARATPASWCSSTGSRSRGPTTR